MAEKRYHIASPEQLHALEAYVKTGRIKALISVWTTTIRRTGKSPWDDKIFAAFQATGKGRQGSCGRLTTAGMCCAPGCTITRRFDGARRT